MVQMNTLSLEEREAFHQEAEARVAVFKYEKPAPDAKPKEVIVLGRTPLVSALIQVVRDGGENNLHYHTNSDTVWTVLRGRARFYGVNDRLLADLGPLEGILMPGGARYWFEKVGPDDLELQQIVAKDHSGGPADRINLEKHKEWMEGDAFLTVYDKPVG